MQRPLLDDDRPVSSRPAPPVISVSVLVTAARLAVERHFGSLWVSGEVSNVYRAASGHLYFTLKDAEAQVKCVLWRSKAQHVDFALRDGLAVEVRATPSIYEPRGEFQLAVDAVRQAGAGALYERFLALKAKLEALGWFDAKRKRALPRFPRRVGIVTSPAGAAIADVITTLRRRWPALGVIVYPTAVQGEGAGREIARTIALANRRAEVDALIVCRGGGSLEDLWAFNEEVVARAIVESSLPVVSGVGHETDFTIADFVADVRAPTPTGAAERVAPDCAEFGHRAEQLGRRVARAGAHVLGMRAQRLDHAARRLVHPAARLRAQAEALARHASRLSRCWSHQAVARSAGVASARLRFARLLRSPPAAALRVQRLEERLVVAADQRVSRPAQRLEALAQNL
ncbi:MAG: exodeoxyribonuclease VII large subunit, partial [Burkholderiales bacterium]|nr:exodeoxyribonuclease VII large subunit [Burkholderiales bacterium]